MKSKNINLTAEIGGYFARDLPGHVDAFPEEVKFQSGRAAPRAFLEFAGIKRIMLPAYICDSVIQAVVDTWSRQSPVLEAGFRMSGEMVGRVIDRALNGTQGPRSITVHHETEFQSRALEDWTDRRGVQLDFIRPGKPVENAFIESFNG